MCYEAQQTKQTEKKQQTGRGMIHRDTQREIGKKQSKERGSKVTTGTTNQTETREERVKQGKKSGVSHSDM